VGDVRCVPIGERKYRERLDLSLECLVIVKTRHWRSTVKLEREGFGHLTVVDDCKQIGKHKVCEILFELYDFGMWNDILVNDLGCRNGKCVR